MLDIILGCIFIIHEELIMIFMGFFLAVNELFTAPINVVLVDGHVQLDRHGLRT